MVLRSFGSRFYAVGGAVQLLFALLPAVGARYFWSNLGSPTTFEEARRITESPLNSAMCGIFGTLAIGAASVGIWLFWRAYTEDREYRNPPKDWRGEQIAPENS